jgi:hypothetical protein
LGGFRAPENPSKLLEGFPAGVLASFPPKLPPKTQFGGLRVGGFDGAAHWEAWNGLLELIPYMSCTPRLLATPHAAPAPIDYANVMSAPGMVRRARRAGQSQGVMGQLQCLQQ